MAQPLLLRYENWGIKGRFLESQVHYTIMLYLYTYILIKPIRVCVAYVIYFTYLHIYIHTYAYSYAIFITNIHYTYTHTHTYLHTHILIYIYTYTQAMLCRRTSPTSCPKEPLEYSLNRWIQLYWRKLLKVRTCVHAYSS